MKTCSQCKEIREYKFFYKKKASKDGYDWWCKFCWRSKTAKTPPSEVIRSKHSIHFTSMQLNRLIDNCHKRANLRCREYGLTASTVAPLMHEFCSQNMYVWEPYHPFRPSIDRIDNNRGYTIDNIQIIWAIENHCKNVYTNDDVILFCKLKLGLTP